MFKIFKTVIKNKISIKAIITFVFLGLLFFGSALAATTPDNKIEFNSPTTYSSVQSVVDGVINWVLGLTAGVVILFLVIGGIYYITAAGDDKQMEEGKKIINYAIIGLIFILISYSVVKTLNSIIFTP